MANNWSEQEVAETVADYFAMLRQELLGEKYNKAMHRRALMKKLSGRSNGSVELKHQNISAVLIEMGIPWIEGYKPRSNYQRSLLPAMVAEYLKAHPDLQALFHKDVQRVPNTPSVEDFLAVMESPPSSEPRGASNSGEVREVPSLYNPAGVNYLEREAQNQALGEAGEQFVMNFERARLIYAGRQALADQIEQVSLTIGPSAGFDIRSYEENGKDRFIEAKTTKYGKSTPFFVTPNELRFSKVNEASYYLYRLFGFRDTPRLFTLQGHLEDKCILVPSEYSARAR
ncbi:DUF3883 domain-containing protein [Alcanivorax sp. JB21]|uniref:DUF3883 domain-containing protein n=1 Tax=Alcanivorax limicola TaxID=2874102 RepID=UPI001CBF1080|nr:DUF3883 domain-containing protein [Alcanivorax limicola]MBZ2189036.1 DUF3883 domain-containing protein [Alcanivorax limicola]